MVNVVNMVDPSTENMDGDPIVAIAPPFETDDAIAGAVETAVVVFVFSVVVLVVVVVVVVDGVTAKL
jgi:hypothetical protein